jgi:integrative and conjugative element protein (TIGR02256 family)
MPRRVLKQMKALANEKFPLETGGVLIGYTGGTHGEQVVIVAITGPGPSAQHTKITFEPDHDYQTAQIADVYRTSKGASTYLGDWHSHPNSAAYLSRRDKKTLRHIGSHRPARLDRPVMVILGEGSPWTLKAWRLIPRRLIAFRRTEYCELDIRETK